MSASLSNLTPAQLALIPAASPPPGVTPNFIDPPSDGPILFIVGSILIALMLFLLGVRLYTKLFITRKVTWDDYTATTAAILTILYFVICCLAVTKAHFGTHMWNISLATLLSDSFIILGFFSNWVTALVWMVAKLSFFLFYLQLFRPLLWLRYSIYFGAIVNVLFYLSIIAATLYYSAPGPGESWQQAYTSPKQAGTLKMTLYIASGSLILDVYIFLLPMFGIWNLQLSRSRKFGVGIVFATGLTACIASSLSIYYKSVLNKHDDDYTYYVLRVLVIAIVEMCVGISASCMPAFSSFLRHGPSWDGLKSAYSSSTSAIKSFIGRSRTRTAATSSQGTAPGSYANMESHPPLELGYVKTMRTFVQGSGGSAKDQSEDGIHLKYGIQQEIEENSSANHAV